MSCIFTAYHLENTLFQENSFHPISFDQKCGKTYLTQMRQEQNGFEKLQWQFFETKRGSTQKCRNLLTDPRQWKRNVFFLCRRTEGSAYHREGIRIPLVVRVSCLRTSALQHGKFWTVICPSKCCASANFSPLHVTWFSFNRDGSRD